MCNKTMISFIHLEELSSNHPKTLIVEAEFFCRVLELPFTDSAVMLVHSLESFPSTCPKSDLRGSPCCTPAPKTQPTPSHEPPSSHRAHFVYQQASSCRSGASHSLRCHLIGLLRCDVTGSQLREERWQPVLCLSSCLRVQPSQAFLQQVILGKGQESESYFRPQIKQRISLK